MTDLVVIIALLIFIGAREAFHISMINKLIDKLMSRNYYDYQLSEAVTQNINKEVVKSEPKFQASVDNELYKQELDSLTNII